MAESDQQAFLRVRRELEQITSRTNVSGVHMPAGLDLALHIPRPGASSDSLVSKAFDSFVDETGWMNPRLCCVDAVVKAASGYDHVVLHSRRSAGLLVVRESFGTLMEIQLILANESRQGFATEVMTRLTKAADEHCVNLWLNAEPVPMARSNIRLDKLIEFFRRFGFVHASEVHDDWKSEYHGWAKCRFLTPMYRYSEREPDPDDLLPEWLRRRTGTPKASPGRSKPVVTTRSPEVKPAGDAGQDQTRAAELPG